MANPLLDALGSIGYALDTPGAYLRGALSGNLGSRASGRDLLTSYGLSSQDDPWGGVKGFGAEAILDPLALAGPVLGATRGIRGLTRAVGMGRPAAKLASTLDGLRIERALPEYAGSGYIGSVLRRGDEDALGHALFASRSGGLETDIARRVPEFSALVPEGAKVGRFHEVGLFDTPTNLREMPAATAFGPTAHRGLGQQMMVDAMAQLPYDWAYNSQASPAAVAMFDRLAAKGMIDLARAPGRAPHLSPYVFRLTPEGRALAGTMGLVHGA